MRRYGRRKTDFVADAATATTRARREGKEEAKPDIGAADALMAAFGLKQADEWEADEDCER